MYYECMTEWHIFNLGTEWRWVTTHVLTVLSLGKDPLTPLGRRLGGLLRWSGHSDKWEKKLSPLPGIKHWLFSPQLSHYTDRVSLAFINTNYVTKHFATFKTGSCKVNMVNLMLYVNDKELTLKKWKFGKHTST